MEDCSRPHKEKIIAMLEESWVPRCSTRMNEFLVLYGGERQFWSSGGAF